MENFKFILSSVFVLALLGLSGYWAFSTMESGSTHVDSQKQIDLEQKNDDLTKEVTKLKKELSLIEIDKELQIQKEKDALDSQIQEPAIVIATPVKTTVSKYQTLINDLQKLVNSKIVLKAKSQGPSVGTVQKFLNIYNNTSSKVDNDYGASTITAVKSFEKAQGFTINGEAGSSEFNKMISWLKSH